MFIKLSDLRVSSQPNLSDERSTRFSCGFWWAYEKCKGAVRRNRTG